MTTLARGALRAYRAALGISSSSAVKVPTWAPAKALLRAARLTKQLARSSSSTPSSSSSSPSSLHSSDMALAEALLRAAAATEAEDTTSPAAASSDGCAGDGGSGGGGGAGESRRAAQSDLGVLLCQEGRDDEAAEVLTAMGFRYRLGKDVLRYPVQQEKKNQKKAAEATMEAHHAYVRAFDGAMPERMLRHLRRVFGARSSFWSQHGGAGAHVETRLVDP